MFGTSDAKAITISFHVRSKQTGTYALNFFLDDDSVHFTKTYTISSADTFEKKTITFPANTSAVIEDDNGKGIEFTWWLRAGSTYTGGSAMSGYEAYSNGDAAVGHAVDFLDDAANEFYLTGVQLEIGEVATPYKYETFAENLARCQRYFRQIGTIRKQGANGDPVGMTIPLEPTMRASPTVTGNSSTGGSHSIAGTGDFPNTQIIYSGTASTSGSTAFLQFTGVKADAEFS